MKDPVGHPCFTAWSRTSTMLRNVELWTWNFRFQIFPGACQKWAENVLVVTFRTIHKIEFDTSQFKIYLHFGCIKNPKTLQFTHSYFIFSKDFDTNELDIEPFSLKVPNNRYDNHSQIETVKMPKLRPEDVQDFTVSKRLF